MILMTNTNDSSHCLASGLHQRSLQHHWVLLRGPVAERKCMSVEWLATTQPACWWGLQGSWFAGHVVGLLGGLVGTSHIGWPHSIFSHIDSMGTTAEKKIEISIKVPYLPPFITFQTRINPFLPRPLVCTFGPCCINATLGRNDLIKMYFSKWH